ncbi:MAG: hypothetical protein IKO51_03650 [Clostridia bacterium]|nr:hypothetical protein [Clostridia bacterium]
MESLSSIFNEAGREKIPFEAVYPYADTPKGPLPAFVSRIAFCNVKEASLSSRAEQVLLKAMTRRDLSPAAERPLRAFAHRAFGSSLTQKQPAQQAPAVVVG